MKSRLMISSWVLLFLAVMLPAASTRLQKKAVSPEFIRYQNQIRAFHMGEHTVSPKNHFGYIPPIVAPLHIDQSQRAALEVADGLPSRYDLRQLNRVTPIKDQLGCGSCWAFAAMASIESALLPGSTKNFSPEHMILNHGFDYDPCDGGHAYMSLAYLSRWGGPVNENDLPYKEGSSLTNGYEELIENHVQEIIFLPERTSYTDNNAIKQLITTYGAVAISYHSDNRYLNTSNAAYYYNGSESTNHGVAAVGWDDSYPAANFKTTPPGNGAFIVKNSWGDSWGDDGFFYLSYYDKSLSRFTSFHNVRSIKDFGINYYLDPLGWCTNYGYGNRQAWGANVFEARNNQPITAVGLVTSDINTQCQISIYRNATRSNPTAGQLVCRQNYTRTYPGYYTVKLDTPVSVSRGQLFSVVVEFQNGGRDNYPVAVEAPFDDYSSDASSKPGESFISPNGRTWEDFHSERANVCIKAFSRPVQLDLSATVTRHQISSWMISRSVAAISIQVSNQEASEFNKAIIFRKKNAYEAFEVWREIPLSEFSAGVYTCTDAYLDKGSTYFYKIVAIDDYDNVLANSGEFTLTENNL